MIQRFTLYVRISHQQLSFERLIITEDSIRHREVTLELLDTLNHINICNKRGRKDQVCGPTIRLNGAQSCTFKSITTYS